MESTALTDMQRILMIQLPAVSVQIVRVQLGVSPADFNLLGKMELYVQFALLSIVLIVIEK